MNAATGCHDNIDCRTRQGTRQDEGSRTPNAEHGQTGTGVGRACEHQPTMVTIGVSFFFASFV